MGFFDRFKRAPPREEPFHAAAKEALTARYGEQAPFAYGANILFADGGPDPLDAVSVFWNDVGPHWHYVTRGVAGAYAHAIPELLGIELSFRLAAQPSDRGTEPEQFFGAIAYHAPTWPLALLNKLARMIVVEGRFFRAGDSMSRLNAPADPAGRIHALSFVEDTELCITRAPTGLFGWLQVVGLTAEQGLVRKAEPRDRPSALIEELRATDPLLVCR